MVKKRQHSLNRRHPGKRLTRDRILVVVEGETEEFYFKALRKDSRTPGVEIFKAKGTSPVDVVDYAESLILNGLMDSDRLILSPKSFERVFVVFDEDNDPSARIAALNKVKKLSGEYKTQEKQPIEFIAADSVPNFEIWFLLHYECLHPQKMVPADSGDRLKRHVPDYVKPMPKMFDRTKENIKCACSRAEKLLADKNREKGDISTNAYLLVKALLRS